MNLPIIRHRDEWEHLLMCPVPDGTGFVMKSSYRVQFDWDKMTEEDAFLTVPVGFHTDLASVPPIVRPLFGTWGRHTAAAVCHDVLYAYGAGTKEMADDLFEALMIADGVEEGDATMMAAAVRVFGRGMFDSPAPDNKVVLSFKGYPV